MKAKLSAVSCYVMHLMCIVVMTCSHTPAFAQIKIWDKRYGGTDFDQLSSCVATHDRGYLLGGYSSSEIGGDKTQFSRGSVDFWIIKLNSKGGKVWDRRFGGKAEDVLTSMLPTTDGGFLLGGWSDSPRGGDKSQSTQGWDDFWIVRIDALGNKLWDRRYGGNLDDHLLSMAATSDGGFLLAGSSYSDISGDKTQSSRGNDDYWVVRIDSDGNQIWDMRYGGSETDLPTEIAATSDGGFLLAGRSSSKEGGDKSEGCRGDADYWIVKIDGYGNKHWDRTFGGALFDMPSKICTTHDDGFFIGGNSDSDISGDVTKPSRSIGWDDIWIVKIDKDGNKIWDQRFGGDHADGLQDIEPTPDGNYLLGGWSYSNISGEKSEAPWDWGDFWIVKMDFDGNYLWDKRYGGYEYDAIFDMTPMPGGNFLLAGASQSDISGDKTQPSRGGYDYWLINFNPNPALTFRPIDLSLICDPFCPILHLEIRSNYFIDITSFSFRITLPPDKAVFTKSGHTFNHDLQSEVHFEIENANTMLVTWKNPQRISFKGEVSLINAAIKILDTSKQIEVCVSDAQGFDAQGKKIETISLCGNIDFSNSKGARIDQDGFNTTETPSKISIYPNPGDGMFKVILPHAGNYKIDITDMHGKTLRKQAVSTEERDVNLDLRSLPKGIFVIKISDGHRSSVERLVYQ